MEIQGSELTQIIDLFDTVYGGGSKIVNTNNENEFEIVINDEDAASFQGKNADSPEDVSVRINTFSGKAELDVDVLIDFLNA